MGAILYAVFCVLTAAVDVAAAQAPPPSRARSVEVIEEETVVRVGPSGSADRRGTIARGTRLALQRRVTGPGCDGFWAQVADDAYVCETSLRFSPDAPHGVAQPPIDRAALLPHRYAFVRVDGTRAFARPSDHFADDYVEALGDGFGLVVRGARTYDGTDFVETRRGLWVERDALEFAAASGFAGRPLSGSAHLAWVRGRSTTVHRGPAGPVIGRLSRRTPVRWLERGRRGWVRLEESGWVRTRRLAFVEVTDRPRSVGPDERWLDVDLTTQVLVAYEGDRPVYATLVSGGRGPAGSRSATPIGEHRIWVKLATSDMDDLQRSDVEQNYAIEAVPWVQYFEGANGLHAAFWHDDFGRPRSHGCVNLSPRDARFLFAFTEPRLPPGWTAVLPTPGHPGTLIRVRRSRP